MKNLLDLPDEIILQIISFKHNILYDNFKNIRYLIKLSRVCWRFYHLCHLIKDNDIFFKINYFRLCDGIDINYKHFLFTKNVLENWGNLKIVVILQFSYDYKWFDIFKPFLEKNKNIHLAFNIENSLEEFEVFYDKNVEYFKEKKINFSINLNFNLVSHFTISHILNNVKDKYNFRNITLHNCRNVKIPEINVLKLKIAYSNNIYFTKKLKNTSKIYLKNSKHIIFKHLENINTLHLKSCYNCIFNDVINIERFKVIDSKIILNKKLVNINLLFIKIIKNFFFIPDDSIIYKLVYLYRYNLNHYRPSFNLEMINISNSIINKIDFIN